MLLHKRFFLLLHKRLACCFTRTSYNIEHSLFATSSAPVLIPDLEKKKTTLRSKIRVLRKDCKGCIQKKVVIAKLEEHLHAQQINFINLKDTIATVKKKLTTANRQRNAITKKVVRKEKIEARLREKRQMFKNLSDSLTLQLK